MKCIKAIRETKRVRLGEIIRTNDDDAREKVKGGFWAYATKTEFKGSNTAKPSDPVEVSETKKKGKSKKELKLEKKQNK